MTNLKRFVLLALICLVIPNMAVFAHTLNWNWLSYDRDVEFFRYRLDDNEWNVVESDVTSFSLEDLPSGESHTLFLECSFDGENWSETASQSLSTPSVVETPVVAEVPIIPSVEVVEQEKPVAGVVIEESIEEKKDDKNFVLRLMFGAPSFGIYDFYNGHNIKDAKAFTVDYPGVGASVEFGYLINRIIEFDLGYSYSFINRADTVIQGGNVINNHSFQLGMTIHIPITGRFGISTAISGGALLAENAGSFSVSPVLGTRLSLDWITSDSLTLSLGTKALFSYNHSNERLYRSMSYIIDGATLAIDMRF